MTASLTHRPLVSVIVPTCNRPGLLGRALNSIRQQDYPSLEVVVCNDGEADISPVLAGFASSLDIVLSVSSPGQGVAANRNAGLIQAHGDLIAYLDDDDLFSPDHISSLATHLEETQAAFVYSDAYRSFWHDRDTDREAVYRDVPFSQDPDPGLLLVRNYIPTLTVLHRRECFETAGVFDETLKTHEDWDLWIRMSRSFSFSHLYHITCEYTVPFDGSSITGEQRKDFLDSLDTIYHRYQEYSQGDPAIGTAQSAMRRKMVREIAYPWLSTAKNLVRRWNRYKRVPRY
ncbi:hypothetical protein AUK40_02365 [Candidatus Wirthbacteria bacterium CG2_30_54_11]|uniref:Glycosyltransferase 2-like domain-containing protein n=1 Tax=Candidatus Wirthbacteria bacterium CG2_30_54_11 TaxID=1817892 RepID=A0A1J5ILD8_9BACT|nr:MAG: hypothetical protein AUK40_02365 [Candidatus Wirthbacteria bacterium CG2_30_54_11]